MSHRGYIFRTIEKLWFPQHSPVFATNLQFNSDMLNKHLAIIESSREVLRESES